MRLTRLACILAAALLTTVTARTAVAAPGTDAELTVIHAIPGLMEPVDVCVNGEYAFTFDYGDVQGPITLPAGSYFLEVKLAGNPVLMATAELEACGNYTAIAHLTYVDGETSGINLEVFENDASSAGNKTRLTVRHTADAPAVDILLKRGKKGKDKK